MYFVSRETFKGSIRARNNPLFADDYRSRIRRVDRMQIESDF